MSVPDVNESTRPVPAAPARVTRSGPRRPRDAEATRDHILDVAERLFAEHGLDGTSLRQIMSEAQVSISLINYHFGTKEGLLRALFARKMIPSNNERLGALDALLARGTPPTVEELVHAYMLPTLKFSNGKPDNFVRVIVRVGSDASDLGRELTAEYLNGLQHRFAEAFAAAVPHATPQGIWWRVHVLLSVIINTMINPDRIRALSNGLCDPRDPRSAFEQMLPILAAAIRATDSMDEHRAKSGRTAAKPARRRR